MKFKEYLPLSIVVLFSSSVLILLDLLGWADFPFPIFCFLCLGLGYLSFRKPEWAFWFFVAFLPLENIIITPENFPISLRPYQLVGSVLSFALIIAWFFKRSKIKMLSLRGICLACKLFKKGSCRTKDEGFGHLDRFVFAFPLFAFLASFLSPDQTVAIKGALILTSFVLIFWLARNFFQTNRQKLEALWFFSLGAVPVILFGIYQALALKFGWQSFVVFEGRINGTFAEPDWFGMYLAFLFAIELWCLLLMNLSRNMTKIGNFRVVSLGKIAAHLDLFLISALILLTVSRSAWLAAIMVVFMYALSNFWFFSKKKDAAKSILGVAVSGGLALIFVVWSGLFTFHFANRAASSVTGMQKITISCQSDDPGVPQKVENVQQLEKFACRHIDLEEIQQERERGMFVSEIYRPDPNVDVRKEIYARTWQTIKQYPVTGIGIGSSALILGEDEHGSGYNASNIFLEIWVSMGIFALAFFVFILAYLPVKLAKNIIRKRKSKNAMRFGSFALITFGAIIIPNLFNAGLLIGFLWVWLALLISLVQKDGK